MAGSGAARAIILRRKPSVRLTLLASNCRLRADGVASMERALAQSRGFAAESSPLALGDVLKAVKDSPNAYAEEVESLEKPPQSVGQQGVLWFANIYPTKAFRFDFRQALTHHNHTTLVPKLLPEGVEVLRMVPREREGGAFVYFRAPPSFVIQVLRNLAKEGGEGEGRKAQFVKKGDQDILGRVCDGISGYLKTHDVRAMLCPQPVRAHRVEGDPYLEDLRARYPSSRIVIHTSIPEGGSAVTEEQVFNRVRKFGQLEDLQALPEGKGYKATFTYAAAAVAARNCLHRAHIVRGDSKSAKLIVSYEPFMQKYIRDLVVNNARFSIPLFIALLMGLAYFVWTPVRTASVQLRIMAALTQADDSNDASRGVGGVWEAFLRLWSRWNRYQSSWLATSWFGKRGGGSLVEDFWNERVEEASALRRWLLTSHDRVILLTGARGNGQSAFLKKVVGKNAIFIDVTSMLEAGGGADDQVFMRRFCRSIGYWPPPMMDRQIKVLLDMLVPGSGKLSRENEVLGAIQLVLAGVTQALIKIQKKHSHRLEVPLIVIDGFTAENKDRRDGFFDLLVIWAAYVAEAHIARVVFVADSSFAEPSILAALGERPERLDVETVMDADLNTTRRVLERHMGKDKADLLTNEDLRIVGGRFRDISALVDHVASGDEPREALTSMVEAGLLTVKTLLAHCPPKAKWTRPQLWRAIRLLASDAGSDGSVPYDVFLWSVFRGDEMGLRSLSQSNLIAINHRGDGGRVSAGSPILAEVFRRLVRQEGGAAVLDLEVANEDIKREQAKVDNFEAELVKLQEIDDIKRDKGRGIVDPNEALRKRKIQLLDLILEQHGKLEKYHKARLDAMAVISKRAKALQHQR